METRDNRLYFGYTKKQLFLCVICYLTNFAFGITDSSKSVYFPLIQSYFHLEYDFQGMFVSVSQLGYSLFSLVVGYLTVKIGFKWSLAIGFLIMLLSYSSCVVFINLIALMCFLIVGGIGQVFLAVSTNVLSTVLFQFHQAAMMNLLHGFYGLGATVGPVLTGYVSSHIHLSYRGVFVAVSVLSMVLFFIILCVPKSLSAYGNDKQQEKEKDSSNTSSSTLNSTSTSTSSNTTTTIEEDENSKFTIGKAFRQPLVWVMGFAAGCLSGIENITMSWAPLYLRDLYGWDPETRGARFISVFFLLFTLSRSLSGFIFDKFGRMPTYLTYLMILIALFLLGFAFGEKGVYILMFTGFFEAPMYPTLMTFATSYFGPIVDRCTCAILFIYMCTSLVLQLLAGMLMKYAGAPWGYRLTIFLVVILLGLILIIRRFMNKKQEREEKALLESTNPV